MIKENKQYHYIYKTTNTLNQKFYIGMHSTNNLNDGYMGSGRRIKASVNTYGKENHITEILEFCSSRDELKLLEEELVNDTLLQNPLCLNLANGGEGGALNKWSAESRQKLSESLRQRENTWGHKVSATNKGKRHSEESIRKAAESRKGPRNGSWKNVDIEKLFELRSSGKTIAETATILGISLSTVKRKWKLRP